jgi:addiction module HigA family antidote
MLDVQHTYQQYQKASVPRIPMSKPLVHPGQHLSDELKDIGVTPTELARQIGVPANRISEIIRGRRSITGDTALRLSHWFGTTPQFWMNLQSAYEIKVAAIYKGEAIARLPRRGDSAGDARGVTSLVR